MAQGNLSLSETARYRLRLGFISFGGSTGVLFSKAAVVNFGGAYAVLGYISQQAVSHYHWIMPEQMMDGLGLAETTPGPRWQGSSGKQCYKTKRCLK